MVPKKSASPGGRAVGTTRAQARRSFQLLRSRREQRSPDGRAARAVRYLAKLAQSAVATRPHDLEEDEVAASALQAAAAATIVRAQVAALLANPCAEEPDALIAHVR